MSDTSYLPSAERLLQLGYGMPQRTSGAFPNITYQNIEWTKAVVVWPASREVRLSAKPVGHTHWSELYTGCPPDAQTFEKVLAINCFIYPEQAQVLPSAAVAEQLAGLRRTFRPEGAPGPALALCGIMTDAIDKATAALGLTLP